MQGHKSLTYQQHCRFQLPDCSLSGALCLRWAIWSKPQGACPFPYFDRFLLLLPMDSHRDKGWAELTLHPATLKGVHLTDFLTWVNTTLNVHTDRLCYKSCTILKKIHHDLARKYTSSQSTHSNASIHILYTHSLSFVSSEIFNTSIGLSVRHRDLPAFEG